MKNIVDLIVYKDGKKTKLVLYEDPQISLNYALADINTFGFKNLNYSQTIVLPSHPVNNEYFEHIYNLNQTRTFDKNIRNSCYLRVNNKVVLSGYFVLQRVNTVKLNVYEYEIVCYNGIGNIAVALGDKKLIGNDNYLDDLLLGSGHTVTATNINNSMSGTQSSYNYSYALAATNDDYNRYSFDPTIVKDPFSTTINFSAYNHFYKPNNDLACGIYFYDILDRIITGAGYTWNASFKNDELFRQLIVFSRTNFDDIIETETFVQRVSPVVQAIYTADSSVSPRESKINGVLLFDASIFSVPLTSVIRNTSVVIGADRAQLLNQNVAGDTDYLLTKDLNNLKNEIEWLQPSTDVTYTVANAVDYNKIPCATGTLDKAVFNKVAIDVVSSYQSNPAINDVTITDSNAFNPISGVYTAKNDCTLSFVFKGKIQLRQLAGGTPVIMPATKLKMHIYHNRKKVDGTYTLDIITTGATTYDINITNTSFATGATDAVDFEIRSEYVTLTAGDTVYLGYNNTGNAGETQPRNASDNSIIPNTLGGVGLVFRFTDYSVKTFSRPSPFGLYSFYSDQKIRLQSTLTVSGLPSGNSVVKFVDVGENGQYWKAMAASANSEFEVTIQNNVPLNIDTVIDVKKGYNRYAFVIVFDPIYDGTNMMGTSISIKASSIMKLYATSGYGVTFYDNNVFLPAEMTQLEFIQQFIKIFNLFVDVDDDNPTFLNFSEYYDYYYYDSNARNKIDWTNKIDLDSNLTIEFFNELSFKKYVFSYKKGSDRLNNEYSSSNNGKIYGEYEITNTKNKLFTEESRIELLFAPTLYYSQQYNTNNYNPTPSGVTVPYFGKNINEPRLLFKKTIVDINAVTQPNDPLLTSFTASAAKSTFNYVIDKTIYVRESYPHIGHLSDLYEGQINDYIFTNLNFGFISDTRFLPPANIDRPIYSYSGDFNTDIQILQHNNLYYKGYEQMYIDYDNSKIISAYFFLDERDIAELKFNNRIALRVNDTTYICRLNKIKDYQPASAPISSTYVELIIIEG